ncbi:hypothetical protein T05_10081 [Trichinella murrelli]|uniref:Uncharacterized protein n=1 Tax=Trichinella murrelli TaxID=144512 RepID=A0A0V0T0G8_9BILA|nr:hypothetical protein T05_10081 [Trichinella murrelli]
MNFRIMSSKERKVMVRQKCDSVEVKVSMRRNSTLNGVRERKVEQNEVSQRRGKGKYEAYLYAEWSTLSGKYCAIKCFRAGICKFLFALGHSLRRRLGLNFKKFEIFKKLPEA